MNYLSPQDHNDLTDDEVSHRNELVDELNGFNTPEELINKVKGLNETDEAWFAAELAAEVAAEIEDTPELKNEVDALSKALQRGVRMAERECEEYERSRDTVVFTMKRTLGEGVPHWPYPHGKYSVSEVERPFVQSRFSESRYPLPSAFS